MSPRRTLIIIVAIVIAAVAAVANILYLTSVQQRANGNAKLLSVFRVDKDIPKGTTGDDAIARSFVKSGKTPANYRPATALTNINQIKGKVALTALATGQVVVEGQFVEPVAAQVTFSQRIPAGQVAVSISVDTLHAVGNLLLPGDKVDMIVPCSPNRPPSPPPGAIMPSGVETFYWQNVTILAIGAASAPTPGQTQAVTNPGSGIMTFALPPLSAARLLLAVAPPVTVVPAPGAPPPPPPSSCLPTLALVPPDNVPTQIPTVDPGNFWPAAGKLTPYEP